MQGRPLLLAKWAEKGKTWLLHAHEVFSPSPDNEWRDGKKFVVRKSFLHSLGELGAEVDLARLHRGFRDHIVRMLGQLERLKALGLDSEPNAVLQAAKALCKAVDGALAFVLQRRSAAEAENTLGWLDAAWTSRLLRWQERRDVIFKTAGSFTSLGSDANSIRVRDTLLEPVFHHQVVYLDASTGQMVENMHFPDLIHEFLEFKVRKRDRRITSSPSVNVRSLSMKMYVSTATQVMRSCLWMMFPYSGISPARGVLHAMYTISEKV